MKGDNKMKITRDELKAVLASLDLQDRLTKSEFLDLLSICRLANATGTVAELFAAYANVEAIEATETGEPDYNGPDTIGLNSASIIAEARRAGIKLGIDPVIAEASIRNYLHLDPAETSPVTVEFFGPENEPLPRGSIVKVARAAAESMSDEKRAEFMARLEAARKMLADCAKRYKETGTFPADTVPAGGDFRDYARTLITNAAAL